MSQAAPRRPDAPPTDESLLADAIGDFVTLKRSGQAPPLEQFVRERTSVHEALAEQLRACLRVLVGEPAEASGRLLPTQLGDFTLLREIGRGGMGVVYAARQKNPDRDVALKLLPPSSSGQAELLERFRREIAVTARLAHPAIVPIFQSGEAGGLPYYTMPLLEGAALDAVVQRMRDEPERAPAANARELALWVARFLAVARALHAAHAHGILHRDVKPSNLFLTSDGRLLILDFGLAHAFGEEALTRTAGAVGTPRFMSPEQVLARPLDGRSDLFSLAATIYEVLALAPAAPGNDREAIFRKVLARDPLPLRRHDPRVPVDLESIVAMALEKSPRRRYADASAFADDLQRFLDLQPVHARPIGPIGRLVRRAQRNPAAAAALVAATLLGVGAIVGPLLATERTRAGQERVVEARTRRHVDAARGDRERGEQLAGEVARLDARIAAERTRIPKWGALLDKAPLLDLETAKAAARTAAEQAVDQAVLEYEFALQERPDDGAARAEIGELVVREAIATDDPARADRFRQLVKLHAPEHVAELDAGGWLTLDTTPSDARLFLFRYEAKDLMLVPVPFSPGNGPASGYLDRFDTRTPTVFFRVDALLATGSQGALPLRVGDRIARICHVSPSHEFFIRRDLVGFRHEHTLEVWRDGIPSEVRLPPQSVADLRGTVELREAFPLPTGSDNDCGPLPITRLPLPAGSYLALLELAGRPTVRLPFVIGRAQETACSTEIWPGDLIGDGFIYVPGGRVRFVGDPAVSDSLPIQEVELPGFAIQRTEITFGDYMDFVDAWRETHPEPQALKAVIPFDSTVDGQSMWSYDEQRQLVLGKGFDPQGSKVTVADVRPIPLYGVSTEQAELYCQWRTDQESDGRWRYDLPTEEEWEHAGRGADGRLFPWGNRFDWTLTHGVYSVPRSDVLQSGVTINDVHPVPAGRVPTDESPFGVRDLAGLVREYCHSPAMPTGWVTRGGAWNERIEIYFHLASRSELLTGDRPNAATGFRMVRRYE